MLASLRNINTGTNPAFVPLVSWWLNLAPQLCVWSLIMMRSTKRLKTTQGVSRTWRKG